MTINYIKTRKKPGIVLHSLEDIEEQFPVLQPGVYLLKDYGNPMAGFAPAFEPLKSVDNLVPFKSGVFTEVMDIANQFFLPETGAKYKELQMSQKMGLLLYGPPGTGKTCLTQLAMEEIAKNHKAICIVATPFSIGIIEHTIKMIRKIQDNPIVVFVDEVENAMRFDEYNYLTFLDGSESVDNFMFVGCTNFIGDIPDRIKNRKSRIKHLIEIKSLPMEVYKDYIRSKIPSISEPKVAEFAFKCEQESLVIDQVKHAIIDYYIDGFSIDDAIKNALSEVKGGDKREPDPFDPR